MKPMQAGTTGVVGDGGLDHSFFYTFIKSALLGRGLLLVLVMTPNDSGDILPSHHQWQRGEVLGKPSSNPFYSQECFLNNKHF